MFTILLSLVSYAVGAFLILSLLAGVIGIVVCMRSSQLSQQME